jgi:hypothetical protein
MSIGDQISFGAGTNVTGSGEVYINEPGIMVLSDGLGNTPVFIFTPQIRYIPMYPYQDLTISIKFGYSEST